MKKTIILVISFLYFSCNESNIQDKNVLKNKKPNEIIMVFKKRSYAKDTLHLVGGAFSLNKNKPIFYTDHKSYENIYLDPKNTDKTDTIKITTSVPITINHKYHFYYDSSYKINTGDTIVFDYDNDAPRVSILNKKELDDDYNFELNYNLAHNVYKGSTEFFYENNKKFRSQEQNQKYGNILRNNIVNKEQSLDSLYRLNKFSADYYSFLKKNFQYKNKIIFSKYNLENVELRNDSLLLIQSYRHFLNSFILNHFDIQYSKKNPNYLALHDSLEKSMLFSVKIKNHLLYDNIKNIIKNYDQSKVNTYFEKFKKEVKDTILVNKISDDFFLDFSNLKSEVENVNLINPSKESTTLK
jgi:hypothetical protein